MGNQETKDKNKQKGQGLIEYLIIVALMGVATITIVKILQGTVNTNLAKIIKSLQGKKNIEIKHPELNKSHFKKKDFSNFIKGSVNNKSGASSE